jgi:hypothetical protein
MAEWKLRLFSRRMFITVGQNVVAKPASSDDQPNDALYTVAQQKMLYLHRTLLETLRFKKYYAQEMRTCERWNLGANFLIAAAASTSLTSATLFNDTAWGSKLLTILLLFSTIATIAKPLLKLDKRIARFSKLQNEYLDLYQKLDRLKTDIQHAGEVLPQHEKRLTRLRDRFDRLGLRNEAVESDHKMLKIMDQVENSIPPTSLWLPPSE